MGQLLAAPPGQAILHDTKVKGGQYRGGVDLYAPGAEVYAPFDAKIAHWHPDRTKCGNPGPDARQCILGEEVRVGRDQKDRHLTGWRVALAHVVPVPSLARHVVAGQLLGHVSGDELHASTNRPTRLPEVTGGPA